MKTLIVLALIASASAPALAGPDFITPDPRNRPLAASDGRAEIAPYDDLAFAHDSAALDDVALVQLESAARWLRRHPQYRVVVEGYADYTGIAAYNEDLATQRAAIVRNHLIALGVRKDNIVVVVYGELGARPENASADRRVILAATERTVREISSHAIDRKRALSVMWTSAGALLTEEPSRRNRTRSLVARR